MSDIVGPEGTVYAVEFSHRSGRDLVNMAKRRPNVVPVIEDARHPGALFWDCLCICALFYALLLPLLRLQIAPPRLRSVLILHTASLCRISDP